MQIEIEEGVFYEPSKEWYEQENRVVEIAIQAMENPPIDLQEEDCRNGSKRELSATYQTKTAKGVFSFTIQKTYAFNASHPAFLQLANHDKVTLEKLS